MAIVFSCPQCKMAIQVDERFAGKKGKCQTCGNVISIPVLQSPKDSSPRRRRVIPVFELLAVLFLVLAYFGYVTALNKPKLPFTSSPQETALPFAASRQKTVSGITWQEYIEECGIGTQYGPLYDKNQARGHKDLQAILDRYASKYKGLLVRWSGKVVSVSAEKDTNVVLLTMPYKWVTAFRKYDDSKLQLDVPAAVDVTNLNEGQEIQFTARLKQQALQTDELSSHQAEWVSW